MTQETTDTAKTRATPIPKSYDRILQGALKLPLADRVAISKALNESIKTEVAQREQQLKDAQAIVNGLGA